MSQHPSLKSASKITVKRNVLKRFERIDTLREQGKWKEEMVAGEEWHVHLELWVQRPF